MEKNNVFAEVKSEKIRSANCKSENRKKVESTNCKFANCHISGRPVNLTNLVRKSAFADLRNFLRTVHLSFLCTSTSYLLNKYGTVPSSTFLL